MKLEDVRKKLREIYNESEIQCDTESAHAKEDELHYSSNKHIQSKKISARSIKI